MATNNFIEFNPNKQNIMTDSEYADESQRLNGVSGIAKAKMHNKLFRQLSVMVAAFGEFIKGTGNDASDSDVASLVTSISKAFASKASLDLRSTFEVAQGTATAITLSSAVATDKFSTTFIAAFTNSAAKTINGKPWYKPGTTVSPSTTAGKAYTIWYDATGSCFFIKASATGTAVAANVLAGTNFSNDDDTDIPGTMVDNGSVGTQTLSTNNAEYTIPAGFHNGLGKVKAAITGLIAGVIKAGTTVGGILGTFTSDATADASKILTGYFGYKNGERVDGNIPVNGSQTSTIQITGSAKPTKSVPAGYTPGGTITAELASALASAIVSGNTIGGVAGTALGASTGQITLSSDMGTFYNFSGGSLVSNWKKAVISGLSFTPRFIMVYAIDGGGYHMTTYNNMGSYGPSLTSVYGGAGNADVRFNISGDASIYNGGGVLPMPSGYITAYYIAIP